MSRVFEIDNGAEEAAMDGILAQFNLKQFDSSSISTPPSLAILMASH